MARRYTSFLSQLHIDDTAGWIAILLGLGILLFVFRPKEAHGQQVAVRPGQRGSGGGTPAKPTSYAGWKILMCLTCIRVEGAEFGIMPDELETLKNLAGTCELYLYSLVSSDEEEDQVKRVLEKEGVYAAGLKPHRVVFCSTLIGKQAIARQLLPSLLLESDKDVVSYMAEHVAHLGYVTTTPASITLKPNTMNAPSVSAYLAKLIS
eukprot:TRINITY_DN2361_c1_g1_i1.p1 TRINITY_DN2361_c1_g1~~TRINITY_DN2361_c1_g1_i1.p1  ORF type:complete len:207 (+),score=45.98 TRINITY_DN2361_c1_g1_i1:43-663(+)